MRGAVDVDKRVPAVERSFQIMRALSRSGPASLTSLVAETGLNKSTAFYVLRTLVALDAIRYQEVTKTYALGPSLIELGSAASRQFDLVGSALHELAGLVSIVDATTVLYRRVGIGEVVIVDRFECDHGVRVTVEPGKHLPIQGGSFGRAFLAYDSAGDLKGVLAAGLVRFSPKSTTKVSEFKRDLQAVRRRGWAVDHEGFALGVSTIAAPIFDRDGSVALVAAAVGFTSLFNDVVVEDCGRQLRAACDLIGHPWTELPSTSVRSAPGSARP